jgi:hypothetical protein
MKTTKQLLLCAAWLGVLGYAIYTTVHIRQLEAQLREARLRLAPAQLACSFDSSFMHYFGQPGVDAVDRAVRRGVTDPEQLAHEVRRDPKLQ